MLYTTEHCSLCEHALDLLLSMPEVAGSELLLIDIANDPLLLDRYGEQIPVLACNGVELPAPFKAAQVLDFLQRAAVG